MIKLSFRKMQQNIWVFRLKTLVNLSILARAYYNLVVAYYFNNQRDKALQMAAYQYTRTNGFEFKKLYDIKSMHVRRR